MASPWTGAWEWVSDEHDGRLILTEGHFCHVFARKDWQPPAGGQPTDAEAARLFKSYSAEAGPITASRDGDGWLIESTSTLAHHPANTGKTVRRAVRVEDDRMVSEVVESDGTRAAAHEHRRLSDLGTGPLAGAWECMATEFDGLLLKTDTEFRYISVEAQRPDITVVGDELSDPDAVVLSRALHSQAGSYKIEGSTTVRTTTVSANPAAHGRETTLEFELNGDVLTLRAGDVHLDWRKL